MKKQILGYVSGYINGYEGVISEMKNSNEDIKRFKFIKNEFNDLLDYIIDIPEKNTDVSDGEAIYVKRIVELQEEVEDLKEIRSITLSAGKELQELRSKLAESERMAEYSSKLWQSTCEKLIKDNDKLQKDLMFWEGNR